MTDEDQALLGRLQGGSLEESRAALAALYRRHAPAVLRFLRRLLDDAHQAEDLLQETFLALARHRGSVRSADLRPWLFSIAGNRVRDAHRRRARRRRREERASQPEVVAPSAADDRLERALQTLPARLRAVVELRFVNELEHAQVAAALGVSLRTAKEWSRQALDLLRERIGGVP